MIKHVIAAALCAVAFSATPAAAQDAANQCRATASGHVKVFDGHTGTLAQAPRETGAGYDALNKIEGVPGESKAREHGTRAAVGRRLQADGQASAPAFRGGVRVAAGDVNGDGATAGPRMSCSNNIKQMGTAAH